MVVICFNANPYLQRKLELANDVESNPGPRRSEEKTKAKMRRSKSQAVDSGVSSDSSLPVEDIEKKEPPPEPNYDAEKVAQLEGDIHALQSQLAGVDVNVERLLASVETLRPVYNEAKAALSMMGSHQQKNNLVFHGMKPDKMELDMMGEPDFCRDILETRIKGILKEHLKISRDITFLQVNRIHSAPDVNGAKPCIACFANWKDKENVLRQAKLLKGCGIYITEDISAKNGSNKGKTRRSSTIVPAAGKPKKEGDCTSGEENKGNNDINNGNIKEGSILESDYTSSASGTD